MGNGAKIKGHHHSGDDHGQCGDAALLDEDVPSRSANGRVSIGNGD
jgi:hypothetical protein